MGNILRDIFSSDEPQYGGTLKFVNSEAYNDFIKALNTSNDEEKGVEISGIDSMEIFIETNAGKQILNDFGEIIQLFIAPSTEPAPYEVSTDFGRYTFDFEKLVKKDEIVVKNNTDAIVHIRIVLKLKEGKVNLTYKTNPNRAETIENIIHSYNAARYLIKSFLKPATSNSEVNKVINFFRKYESFWKRVHEIEKLLDIHFLPKNISDTLEDRMDIEQLYLLLIKKMPIRENLRDISLSIKHKEFSFEKGLKEGDKYGITLNEAYEYKVYGEKLSIFFATFIFNAIIDSIDDNQENREYIIKCVGTDSEPIYKVYEGFKTLDEAETALNDLNEFNDNLANAKTFNDIMHEMQVEYHSAICDRE